jgi:fatty-acid desaturase
LCAVQDGPLLLQGQTKDWASEHKEHCKLVDSIMDLIGQGARPFALDDFAATEWVAFA